jgi:hypothetical protein
MANLTPLQIDVDGLINPSFVAANAGGDTFPNDGKRTYFHAKNGSGGAIVITFDDLYSIAPTGATSFDPDVEVSVPAGQEAKIGPFPISRFGDSVAVTYSGVTSLTVGVFKL